MNKIAKQRLNENLKQSMRYLTLVFNDFFILAIIFLFGALMFWYAQSMKTMPSNLWFYKPLVGLLLFLPLLTGRLVTLIREADMQFLFTQDENMGEYLRPMHRYSLVLPFILELLLAGIVFPFATIKAEISSIEYILLIVTMLITKEAELEVEKANLYFGKKIGFGLVSVIVLIIAVIGAYYPITALVFAIIAEYGDIPNFKPIFGKKMNKKVIFDWRYAVESERARKDRVYSIFSMFTDVKERRVAIKRRKYLDFLLPKSLAGENPNRFLYRRSLLRNPEYLNLVVRMTLFAILISWLVQDWRWALGLSALVIFLTIYQLLPMASEYDSNIMYHVYPIVKDNREKDMAKVLNLVLLGQWLLISILWFVILPFDLNIFTAVAALFVFIWFMVLVYLPNKVRAKNRR